MTRCKFVCVVVTKRAGWKPGQEFVFEAELAPVQGGSSENEDFFAATPSGAIHLGLMQADHFVPGKSYYIDFTEAES